MRECLALGCLPRTTTTRYHRHRSSTPVHTGYASWCLENTRRDMSTISRLHVSKTYAPDQNGAKRFARRYGDKLVCVRHRLSDDGAMRHTTVELLVESTPVASRTRTLVALRIPPNDKHTRTLLMACGAHWQPKEKYWLVSRLVAKNLRLLGHMVQMVGANRMGEDGR